MGLFDLFKKTPMVRCKQCGVQIKETDAHRHGDGVYCSICFGRQDFGSSGVSNIKIDIPNIPNRKETAKHESGSNATPALIQDIKKEFDTAGIKCFSAQFSDQWEVHAGVNGKDTTYTIKFICKGVDDKNVGLRIFDLIKVTSGNRTEVLELLSRFQSTYRFWRFNLDNGGNVNVEYDFPPATSGYGKMAVELFLRTMKMVDDIYLELSRTARM